MILKKNIYTIIISIIFLLYILRIMTVNFNLTLPKKIYYGTGETVSIEDNFFDSSNENMNGYSLNVIDAKLMSIDEFNDMYCITEHKDNVKNYLYLIKIEFENTNNKDDVKFQAKYKKR